MRTPVRESFSYGIRHILLWFNEVWPYASLNHDEICRIPYENVSHTGVRILPIVSHSGALINFSHWIKCCDFPQNWDKMEGLHHKLTPIGGKSTLISGLTSICGFDAVPVNADYAVNFALTSFWAGQFHKNLQACDNS